MSMHDDTLRTFSRDSRAYEAPDAPFSHDISLEVSPDFKKSRLSVPGRLNLLNVLVILSSLVGIIGAFEIHKGATLHDLNYKHSKYITYFINEFESLSPGTKDLEFTRSIVENIRAQPQACLEVTSGLERAILKILGTHEAIDLCVRDLALSNQTLIQIDQYVRGEIDWATLNDLMIGAQHQFAENSEQFGILITRTVNVTFIAVLVIMILKGVLVPAVGWALSRSVSRDYDKLERTEVALRQERERVELIQEEQLATVRRLVAGIAHEVNTPVGICVTAISHLTEECDAFAARYNDGAMTRDDLENFTASARQSSKIISSNLGRASDLIRSFKSVAVDQSSEERREINVADYIDDILLSLRPRLKQTNIDLSVNCPPDFILDTYPGALAQIITNLVENSILHAFDPGQSGDIGITVASHAESDKIITALTYSDNGRGMDEETLAKIYDPYFTTRRGEGGSGLGMHILFNLVSQSLGGSIDCRSRLGSGTTFFIRFESKLNNADQPLVGAK